MPAEPHLHTWKCFRRELRHCCTTFVEDPQSRVRWFVRAKLGYIYTARASEISLTSSWSELEHLQEGQRANLILRPGLDGCFVDHVVMSWLEGDGATMGSK